MDLNMNDAIQIGRELMLASLLLVAPVVLVSLIVGLVISIGQTVTSIQEQTLTFAPRIFAVSLVIAFSIPWSLNVLINFTHQMFFYAAEATR